MADTETTEAAATAKALTVIDDMPNRRLFDSTDEAAAYIGKCQADFADFGGYPVAAVGLTDEGEFDPAVYTDEMRVCVSVLTQRGEGAGSSTVKAIVIYPSPKLESVLASATGKDWLTAILEKELNHVAVRQLRKADTADGMPMLDAIQAMPTTLEAYTTSGRESSGGILETYNALWQTIKKTISAKASAFRIANLSKKEMRKGIESASYASNVYGALEDRMNKKGEAESFFEIAGQYGLLLAKKQGLDPAFFERALATRNEKTIEIGDDEDGEFDLEAMAAAVSVESTEAAPATGEENPADPLVETEEAPAA